MIKSNSYKEKKWYIGIIYILISAWSSSGWAHTTPFRAAVVEEQGHRPTMEDAHATYVNEHMAFFGLYDGHGGRNVADFAASYLHKALVNHFKESSLDEYSIPSLLHQAFLTTHTQLDHLLGTALHQGCTALTSLIYKNTLYVANAGDSRAVLCRKGKAIELSTDHKPNRPDEKERIEKQGGNVTMRSVARVNGILAISRALGDKALNPYVIPDPEITITPLTPDDQFIIMACDGVWDVIDNQEAVNVVRQALAVDSPNLESAAEELKNHALIKGSRDNISVILIDLTVPAS
jgi:serine/threonine protein phosphatase PrpC